MADKIPIVKWTKAEELSVDKIALTDDPAIETLGLLFDKTTLNRKNLTDEQAMQVVLFSMMAEFQDMTYYTPQDPGKFSSLEGRRILAAPAMIANKLIFRLDEDDDPYFGYFDAEFIRDAAYQFSRFGLQGAFNVEHNQEEDTTGVSLVEQWIVEDSEQDKSRYFGFTLPVGSWFTVLQFTEEAWQTYVADRDKLGLSVEAYLQEQIVLKRLGK